MILLSSSLDKVHPEPNTNGYESVYLKSEHEPNEKPKVIVKVFYLDEKERDKVINVLKLIR